MFSMGISYYLSRMICFFAELNKEKVISETLAFAQKALRMPKFAKGRLEWKLYQIGFGLLIIFLFS